MDCFNRQDWAGMLPLLSEEIERWEVGAPRPVRGHREFLAEMPPGPEVRSLRSDVARMVEEGNIVVAEGTVRVTKHDDSEIVVRFCTVFEFEGPRVRRLVAYTVVV